MESAPRFVDKSMTDVTPGAAYVLKQDDYSFSIWNKDIVQVLVIGVNEHFIHIVIIWKNDSSRMSAIRIKQWKFYQESLVRL